MEPYPQGVYRPRNPKKTAFHRLGEEDYEEFGVRCPDYDHEYLLAYS